MAPMPSNKILHILKPLDGSESADEQIVTADCGHECTAAPKTHDLLTDLRLTHTIYCINCLLEEDR